MRILVTGFPPFPGRPSNPSQLVIEQLSSRSGEFQEHDLVAALLPVEYQGVERAFSDLLLNHKPEVVLSLGVGRHLETLRLESRGVNLDSASIPDNAEELRAGIPIVQNAPPELKSRVDLELLANDLSVLEIPSEVSQDAGSYVCNHLLFYATYLQQIQQLPFEFLFIHVPTEENGFQLDRTVRGIEYIVSWLTRTVR